MKETNDQYFEGILQLRNIDDEVLEEIDKKLSKVTKKGISISKIKDVKNGLDLYFNNKKYIQKLGQELQKKFGGILKISPQLFSRDKQTSKDLYRVNVLLKLFDFKVGDILKINDSYIKITSLDKKINGIDLELNKKKSFDYNDDYKIIKKYKTTVCKIKPDIEVLHPETYQSILIQNKAKVKNGEKVKVALDKNKIFIVD
jgi:nonsense-mediated mRNA decay protein 3